MFNYFVIWFIFMDFIIGSGFFIQSYNIDF